ncbi:MULTISPECIES: alpha/beta fold hydrolase [unclassified Massilia]|uniref:alpha/beta fold hydrolase n=1 Tax=unclassified Massilia TaxID=2609279 RepID=UPI001B827CD4|nr:MULTISPECIES: alpha/beta hydrolase [unclassified Massilia]MBQ5939932.1 alpha/beta hydrolase [Massilia sp. AB1]MBQ5964319.1 alpha/beta hydrolase [Massilia sp. ZL223]
MTRLPSIHLLVVAVLAAFAALAFFTPVQVAETLFTLDRKLSGLERKELVLPGGERIVYLEGGKGEPLLLLHGFRGNKDHFTRTARSLTGHYRVIVPDLLGFGESGHPPGADYTPAAHARRMHAFLRQLGVDAAHLGGSSMGGQIALHYAALYPEQTRSLWLLAPNGVPGAEPGEVARSVAAGGRNVLMAKNEEEFAELFEVVMADPPFMPGFVRNVIAQESLRYQALHERIFVDVNRSPAPGAVKAPALIVWGAQDRVLHVSGAAALARSMPQAKVIVMPGVGHLPMLERDRQVAEDYLAFRKALGW